MSKGFKKLLVFSAAIGAALGALYYFTQKRTDRELDDFDDFDDEDDDFIEDLDEHTEDEKRSYVSLTPVSASVKEAVSDALSKAEGVVSDAASKITSFADKAAQRTDIPEAAETVEEFFDEDSTEASGEETTF